MSDQNQGASLLSPVYPSIKRKRGRPCKSVYVQGENTPVTPESDNPKSNQQSVWLSNHASSDMLGQIVSGVIEGSFDAGYLLNVKVGDTNTHLRGAVFLPGLFAPITGANDVAPHAKMYKRKDIPIPFVNLQGHHVVSPTSGKSEKPTEQKTNASNLPDRVLHTEVQPGASITSESQTASILIPPVSNFINESGLPLGQKVMQEQNLDSGLHNDKSVGQHQPLQGFEGFKPMKGPNINVEASKASELVSANLAATLPPTETVNLKPEVEHQVLSYDLIPLEIIHDDLISLDVGNRGTPKIAESEPQAMACDTGIDVLVKQVSSRQDTELELAQKIMNGGNTSQMDGFSASDEVGTAATAPCSASMVSLPVMIFGAETIPYEGKSAAEESVVPTTVVPEINTSPMNAEDAFEAPHSSFSIQGGIES